ncbi:Rieske 2Fe-2S domain-containing protein [Corynebacterium poyangense]|uniref:Rieske 2Fe-2S domain-containing protein n=1 Tax=Corynebacterium poyangense TaxID=2684405 RepID=A0A7H0SRZ0_9CORY|nr:Rieske (2Fe-2S) protein [Corynebacterium poyangense]QNQ91315.1 Rieske 2Fe-2S domain-containing protein [Corynebacterium poyangense]
MTQQSSPNSQPCSRRLFLVGTGTTLAGVLLAACGSDKSQELKSSDVPVGSAVIIGDLIVAQPEPGQYRAYSATCPHQGAKISQVEGNTVQCLAHNSKFSIKDGSVVSGPSKKPLSEATISVQGDNLSVS